MSGGGIESGVAAGELVFFYGTLREGFDVRRQLAVDESLEWIGRHSVRGLLHDLGTYPAFTPGDGVVVGDVYRVLDPAAVAVLDAYEGYWPQDPDGSWYVRVRVGLSDGAGSVWIYRYNRPVPPSEVVAGGDWVRHWESVPGEHF